MPSGVVYRIAEPADFPALAQLRWALKTEDQHPPEGEDFARFRDAFRHSDHDEAVHWLACADNAPIAVMSVVLVKKLAAPGRAAARWGYLTNCYVALAHRDGGVGAGLLAAIQAWAQTEALEFLIVWPSARAFDFYRRNGFSAPSDALAWTPQG